MKLHRLLIPLALSSLALASCSPGSSARSSGAGSLTPEARLALGTLKLEGTPQAVDKTEAAKLLPLWQLLAQLNGSTSGAPEEVSAVLEQIRTTMSSQQIAAMDDMQLTRADMASAFQQQDQGGSSGQSRSGSSNNSSRTSRSGGAQFFFEGGGPPPGGTFPGGTGANRSSGSSSSGSSASQASAAQRAEAFAKAINVRLVEQVIQLLQSRLGS